MEEFYISNNDLTSQSMAWLSKKDWKNLKVIHLHDNKIDDEGALEFVEGEWPSLKNIEMGICYVR